MGESAAARLDQCSGEDATGPARRMDCLAQVISEIHRQWDARSQELPPRSLGLDLPSEGGERAWSFWQGLAEEVRNAAITSEPEAAAKMRPPHVFKNGAEPREDGRGADAGGGNAEGSLNTTGAGRADQWDQKDGGFRSTGLPQVYWTMNISDQRPQMVCTLALAGANPPQIQLGVKHQGTGLQHPAGWDILVINLNDCFFAIPLCPEDRPKFAFQVPAVNNSEPGQRYQWKVLPQGCRNSPTICQWYVAQALSGVHEQFLDAYFYHYMDDILVAAPTQEGLLRIEPQLLAALCCYRLQVTPEKVQQQPRWKYLGVKILDQTIQHQEVQFTDSIKTLNDAQKLLGVIDWLCPYLGLTTEQLSPLFDILKGDTHLDSPRTLTPRGTTSAVDGAASSFYSSDILSRPFH
ncbi:uncharacterized protein LOC122149478 [Catharus ustulatus]|uniref:uncharacterized protein LOC122149478 n=1 Tax=Catharus ustulatus TaxID=91951 RepID=UPI001C5B8738|nr:uncharacterized protein LOC122149478 [Catharus ustulatus]